MRLELYEEATLNSTTTFLGVMGVAIIGPLVLAAVIAGVITWLSRQVSLAGPAAPEARPQKPSQSSKTSVTPVQSTLTAVTEPQAGEPEVEAFASEAAGFEKQETHHRLVPVWLVVVYAIVIVWALIYILVEVVPFFKPMTPQNAPAVAPAVTVAPAVPQALTYSGSGNAVNGEKLFASQGCAACHSLKEGEKIIGPSLFHAGQAALGRIKDLTYKGKARTAQEYIRESIVEPNIYIVPGYSAGVMIQDFGKKLTAQDIDDLVAFLMTR
jgi:nitric oxide reductase subunit C